jgi:hypothetical protein
MIQLYLKTYFWNIDRNKWCTLPSLPFGAMITSCNTVIGGQCHYQCIRGYVSYSENHMTANSNISLYSICSDNGVGNGLKLLIVDLFFINSCGGSGEKLLLSVESLFLKFNRIYSYFFVSKLFLFLSKTKLYSALNWKLSKETTFECFYMNSLNYIHFSQYFKDEKFESSTDFKALES